MTPLSFEWQWNMDYFIFMGLLYLVVLVVGCGLIVAYVKTWLALQKEQKSVSDSSRIFSRSKYSEY